MAAPSFAIFKGWDTVRLALTALSSAKNYTGKVKIKGSRN